LGKIVEKTASPLFSWLVVPWGATRTNKPFIINDIILLIKDSNMTLFVFERSL
jgi:hypothetical protein